MRPSNVRIGLVLTTSLAIAIAAADPGSLRVATWNISTYTGGRVADIQNAVYGVYNGLSMNPDVIMAQEIQSATAASAFVAALNGVSGGPGDWAAAYGPLTGTDATSQANDQVVFYRTGKISPVGAPVPILATTSTSGAARQVYRWDFALANDSESEVLSLYDNHLKAGSSTSDNARRQVATDAIRADANALPSNYHAVFGGDMNVQSSSQSAYQSLVGSQTSDRGRFFDPIASPGSWNGNVNFKFLDTQDPSGPGGMDDRHDQILLDASFGDGLGLEYVGSFGTRFSTTTWNDPNHSYRVWGNDGSSFNQSLTIAGNAMVGASIAQSLVNDATVNGGHLPVFLDLRYTARPVPEPAPMVALALGALALLRRRRRA